jgi:hypothetical protein
VITFAGNHYPGKLFEYLTGELGYSVKEAWSGIYHISGGTMAMQLINRKRLSGENLWVKGLGDDLSFEELNSLIAGSVEEESAVKGAIVEENKRLRREHERFRQETERLRREIEQLRGNV